MSERSKRSGSKWRPLRLAAGALLLFGLALLVVALFISATPLGEAAFGLVILGVPTMAAGGLLWWLEGVDAKAKAGDRSRRRRRRRRSLGESSRFSPSEQLSMSPSELGPVTLVGFDAEADPDLDPAVPFRPSMADWTLSRPAPLSPAPKPLPPAVSLPFRRSAPVPFQGSASAPFQSSSPVPLDGMARTPSAQPTAPGSSSRRMPLDPLQPPVTSAAATSAHTPMRPNLQPLSTGHSGLTQHPASPAPATPATPPTPPFGRSSPMPLDALGDPPARRGANAAEGFAPGVSPRATELPTDAASALRAQPDDSDIADGIAVPYKRAGASAPRERGNEVSAALRQSAAPSMRVQLPNPDDVPTVPPPVAGVATPPPPTASPATATLLPAAAPDGTGRQGSNGATIALGAQAAETGEAAPRSMGINGATLRHLPASSAAHSAAHSVVHPSAHSPILAPPTPPLPAPVPARAAPALSPPPRPQAWQAPPLPLAPLPLPPMVVPPVPMPESMAPLSIAPLPLPPLALPPLVLPPLMLPPLPYPLSGTAAEAVPPSHELQPEPTGWSATMLAGLHWRRFEAVVETLYRQAGFRVRTQPHGSHGGLHIWLYSRHQVGPPVSVVRCERGHGVPVGVALLRELSGVMFAQGARRGHFVSGVGFTVEAQNYAQRHGIHLLDVAGLLALIQARSGEQQHALLEAAQERP